MRAVEPYYNGTQVIIEIVSFSRWELDVMRKPGWLLSAALLIVFTMFALRGGTSAEPLGQVTNTPPTLNSIPPIFQDTGSAGASYPVTASDFEATQTLTFSLSGVPAGWTISFAPTSVVGAGTVSMDVAQPVGGAPVGIYQFTVVVTDNGTPPLSAQQLVTVFVTAVGAPTLTPTVTRTPTMTMTPTITGTYTPTATITATVTPFPTFAPPTNTAVPSPTFIPPLPSRTPLPRSANAGQAIPLSGARVHFVANRDGVNVRIIPAIGAPLAGIINAGFDGYAEAISGDGEWLRFNFEGNDAWVGFPVVSVIDGDLNALPVADPRTIPYGGFENPRAGISTVVSANQARLEMSGLRVRGGPGLGYPVLANAPRYSVFSLLGRNPEGTWLQVNFEGTLGWVAGQYLQFLTPGGIQNLPIGGIVADSLPFSDRTFDSYTDTLRLLLSRIEIATASLEAIRARWTQVALGNGLQCGDYPFQPTDYNIPNPVLAAFYGTLDPLQTDFNAAMGQLRHAIDLLIDTCEGRLSPADTVQQALDTINQVDSLFASLRSRLNALIPPDLVFDPNTACLFTFNNRSEVVPRLLINRVASVRFNRDNLIDGFCFDGAAGASYKIEVLAFTGNPQPRVSVSPFDNPTNFISVGSASAEKTLVTLAPILIPATGRYLVILSDLVDRPAPVEGEIAILLTDVTTATTSSAANLGIDANGNLVVAPVPNTNPVPIFTPGAVTTPLAGGTPGTVDPSLCPNVTYTCSQIQAVGGSCINAQACLQAGNTSLDGDLDGIPCETILCQGN
ncbi:MAG: SH3 domain-containing protein [Anaerolineae bacterium]